MRNIIIDCDPGHDDAMAILLALAHPKAFNILGITTVGGNQTLEQVTKNALKVLSVAKCDIPVYAGAMEPLINTLRTAPEAHGETGMDGPVICDDDILYKVKEEQALIFLKETLERASKPITILALGPLTNIALLLKSFPHIKTKIKEIALMGGSIYSGNITSKAEFNFYVDPHAAKIVFESKLPIVMAGLEVCDEASIKHEEIELFKGKGAVSNFVYELLEFYIQYSKQLNKEESPIFDPCPLMYLLKPEIFEGKDYFVSIDASNGPCMGMSIVDTRNFDKKQKKNTFVLEHVNRKEFIAMLVQACESLDCKV